MGRIPQPDKGLFTPEQTEYLNMLLREIEKSLQIIPAMPLEKDPYYPSNFVPTRVLDSSTATTAVVANVLGTLINALKKSGVIK